MGPTHNIGYKNAPSPFAVVDALEARGGPSGADLVTVAEGNGGEAHDASSALDTLSGSARLQNNIVSMGWNFDKDTEDRGSAEGPEVSLSLPSVRAMRATADGFAGDSLAGEPVERALLLSLIADDAVPGAWTEARSQEEATAAALEPEGRQQAVEDSVAPHSGGSNHGNAVEVEAVPKPISKPKARGVAGIFRKFWQ
jgi:hypothetical protein